MAAEKAKVQQKGKTVYLNTGVDQTKNSDKDFYPRVIVHAELYPRIAEISK